MEIEKELYSGKAKSVYTTEDPNRLVLRFRDDTSAFDGPKIEQLAHKGMINNKTNAFVMTQIERASTGSGLRVISTQIHWLLGCVLMNRLPEPGRGVVRTAFHASAA
jgi:phosphoribosylaminoimidazole-succinocarboxamide synthase